MLCEVVIVDDTKQRSFRAKSSGVNKCVPGHDVKGPGTLADRTTSPSQPELLGLAQ